MRRLTGAHPMPCYFKSLSLAQAAQTAEPHLTERDLLFRFLGPPLCAIERPCRSETLISTAYSWVNIATAQKAAILTQGVKFTSALQANAFCRYLEMSTLL